jgi:segregation and condensation protein B
VGRPLLYGTTKRFLEVFGLSSLEDLPEVEELTLPDSE